MTRVAAAVDPEPPRPGLRLEVTAGNAAGTVIDVDADLLIGREADGPGRLAEDVEISRRHARVFRTAAGGYAIEDLVSTNGTHVNGRRISDVTALGAGDRIDIGTTTLVVRHRVVDPAEGLVALLPVEAGLAAPQAGPEPLRVAATAALRLEIDFAGRLVRLALDDEAGPLTVVLRDGRWQVVPGA